MNKLTIRNNVDNPFLVSMDVDGVDISKLAVRAELVFERLSFPVLKVEIPIGEIDGVLNDVSGFIVGVQERESAADTSYFGGKDLENEKQADFDRRKADIRAEIKKQKEKMQ
jgi:hypothetical protein